jgi:hypothetical protein
MKLTADHDQRRVHLVLGGTGLALGRSGRQVVFYAANVVVIGETAGTGAHEQSLGLLSGQVEGELEGHWAR